jgi:hypothetical protein
MSLCLPNYDAVKTYRRVALHINLGTRWRSVISFTLRKLYYRQKSRYLLGGHQSRSGRGENPMSYKPSEDVTNYMEQNPWEANIHSACQKISRFLCNPTVHHRFHEGLPLVHILSEMHPVHIFPLYLSTIKSIIILPSKPRSSEWSLSFRFSS